MSDADRVMDLQVALLTGELTADDARELLRLFRARPDLLRDLSSSLAIDRLLMIAAEPAEESVAFSQEVVTRLELEPHRDAFTRTVGNRLKPHGARWSRIVLPIAAAVALFLGFAWFFKRDRAPARIYAVADITWTTGSGPALGSALAVGSTVEIDSGLLELTLPGRGHVVLEGPASLTIDGRKELSLPRGQAVFYVTTGGQGLAVHTPHGTAIDLGTSFALDVRGEASELHILEGSVSFESVSGSRRTLRAGNAIRANREVVAIASDSDRFVRRVAAARPTSQPSHYWPCAEGSGLRAATSDARLPFVLKGVTPAHATPTWTEGPQNSSALQFDGKGAFAQSIFPGVEGSSPRTVALWVKVPRDSSPEDAGAIVSWGRFEWREPGVMFELTLNRDATLGPLGTLQLDAFGHRVTGAVDLRDGQWHHLAVMTYQGNDDSPRTHVLFYLDGELAISSPRSIPRLDTLPGAPGRGVLLGRTIQSTNISHPPEKSFFRGCLGGVFIGPETLGTSELRLLMQGQPPRRR